MSDTSPASGQTPDVAELTAAIARMGGLLLSAQTVDTAVGLVTTLAAAAIPGTSGAGVTLIDARGKRTTAASNPLVQQADALQYELDAGPCLTAWRDQVVVRIDDIDTEQRWPQWTSAVSEFGVRSVLSAPLLADTSVGAIKVYSGQLNAYGTESTRLLELFARQAAILLANTQTLSEARGLTAQLTQALQNRDIIGQAKGVLLSQGARDEQHAFSMLVAASQRSNVKLHEVARRLVASVIARNARAGT